MLKPSGPLKNSGKIVMTVMRSMLDPSIEEACGWINVDRACRPVHSRHNTVVRNEDGAATAVDFERESLRELIRRTHHAHRLAVRELHAHAHELVDVDLVSPERLGFAGGNQQQSIAPRVRGVSVFDFIEVHQEPLLKWRRSG